MRGGKGEGEGCHGQYRLQVLAYARGSGIIDCAVWLLIATCQENNNDNNNNNHRR